MAADDELRSLLLVICLALPLLWPSSQRQDDFLLEGRRGSPRTVGVCRRVNRISCRIQDIGCCLGKKQPELVSSHTWVDLAQSSIVELLLI